MGIEELFCIVFSSIVGLIIFVGLWRWGLYVKYTVISSDNPYGYYGRTVVCYCIGDDTRSSYKEILWKDPIWKEIDRLNICALPGTRETGGCFVTTQPFRLKWLKYRMALDAFPVFRSGRRLSVKTAGHSPYIRTTSVSTFSFSNTFAILFTVTVVFPFIAAMSYNKPLSVYSSLPHFGQYWKSSSVV